MTASSSATLPPPRAQAVYNTKKSEDEELSKGFSITLTRRDFRVLQAGVWLNDEARGRCPPARGVTRGAAARSLSPAFAALRPPPPPPPLHTLTVQVVNFYGGLIGDRHERVMAARAAEADAAARSAGAPPPPPLRPIKVFNSFFFTTLTRDVREGGQVVSRGYNYEGVRRWTLRPVRTDVFATECVIVPLNFGNTHWALALVFPQASACRAVCGGRGALAAFGRPTPPHTAALRCSDDASACGIALAASASTSTRRSCAGWRTNFATSSRRCVVGRHRGCSRCVA